MYDLNKVDLNYMKYFYFVVKSNGFTKAAEKLHVQQPVVSRAIRLLECQIGGKLLERQRKQIILTALGHRVYGITQKIFEQVEILNQLDLEEEKSIGEFRFATSDSFSPEIMGPIITKFREEYPKLKLIHLSGPANLYLAKIESGEIDLGVFFNVPDLTKNLVKTKLTTVEFVYSILKKNSGKDSFLDSFIATLLEKNRLPLFDKYKASRKNATIVAVSNSTIARKGMVISGVGVSLLPKFLIKTELERGVLKDIGHENIQLPVYLVERVSSYRNKIKRDFLKVFEQYVG